MVAKKASSKAEASDSFAVKWGKPLPNSWYPGVSSFFSNVVCSMRESAGLMCVLPSRNTAGAPTRSTDHAALTARSPEQGVYVRHSGHVFSAAANTLLKCALHCLLAIPGWNLPALTCSRGTKNVSQLASQRKLRYRNKSSSLVPAFGLLAPHPSQISLYGGGRTEPLVVAGAGGGGGSRAGVPGGGLDGEIPGTKVKSPPPALHPVPASWRHSEFG